MPFARSQYQVAFTPQVAQQAVRRQTHPKTGRKQ
jgi:hypothetical protein